MLNSIYVKLCTYGIYMHIRQDWLSITLLKCCTCITCIKLSLIIWILISDQCHMTYLIDSLLPLCLD